MSDFLIVIISVGIHVKKKFIKNPRAEKLDLASLNTMACII